MIRSEQLFQQQVSAAPTCGLAVVIVEWRSSFEMEDRCMKEDDFLASLATVPSTIEVPDLDAVDLMRHVTQECGLGRPLCNTMSRWDFYRSVYADLGSRKQVDIGGRGQRFEFIVWKPAPNSEIWKPGGGGVTRKVRSRFARLGFHGHVPAFLAVIAKYKPLYGTYVTIPDDYGCWFSHPTDVPRLPVYSRRDVGFLSSTLHVNPTDSGEGDYFLFATAFIAFRPAQS